MNFYTIILSVIFFLIIIFILPDQNIECPDEIYKILFEEKIAEVEKIGKFIIPDEVKIAFWINTHIKYKAEPKEKDKWQSPEETLRLRTGDCEDKAILFLYFMNKKYFYSNKKKQYLRVQIKKSKQYHIIAKIDNYLFDTYDPEDYVILETYNEFQVYWFIKLSKIWY